MTTESHSEKYQTAAKFIKVTGILSIIFGALGALFGIAYVLIYPHIPPDPETADIPVVFLTIATTILWTIPHAFLTVSGIQLIKHPAPSKVRALAITTIVIGAIWNIILLAFAIVNLTQLREYTAEYIDADTVPKAS